jgi:hypothetical protein
MSNLTIEECPFISAVENSQWTEIPANIQFIGLSKNDLSKQLNSTPIF